MTTPQSNPTSSGQYELWKQIYAEVGDVGNTCYYTGLQTDSDEPYPSVPMDLEEATDKIMALVAHHTQEAVAAAVIKQIEPGKEYVLFVKGDPEPYMGVAKKLRQVKLIITGNAELKEVKEALRQLSAPHPQQNTTGTEDR